MQSMTIPLLRLLRPHQWLKNGFVFVGLLFGHAWADPVKLGQALAAGGWLVSADDRIREHFPRAIWD